jgi:hypothetical protein
MYLGASILANAQNVRKPMDEQTLRKSYRLLTPQERKTEALEKANKPLPALISRRLFIAAGVIGTVSVSISRRNLMAANAEPVYSRWKSFLQFAGLAAGLMGYGPVVELVTNFISAVRARDPQQAAAILAESEFLRGKKYLDPLRVPNIPEDWKPSITQDGRVALPFLHSDGLNGVVSHLLGNQVFSRLSGPTDLTIPAINKMLRRIGFAPKDLSGIFSPKEQLVTAFSKFENSDPSSGGDKYKSDADAILRLFYRNTGLGTGQNDFVIENVNDPVSRTRKFIENVVVVRYDP